MNALADVFAADVSTVALAYDHELCNGGEIADI